MLRFERPAKNAPGADAAADVAAGVSPDVEGGVPPPGKNGRATLGVILRTRVFFRPAGRPALRQAGGAGGPPA